MNQNFTLEEINCKLGWSLCQFNGAVVRNATRMVSLPANQSVLLDSPDFSDNYFHLLPGEYKTIKVKKLITFVFILYACFLNAQKTESISLNGAWTLCYGIYDRN